MSFAQLSEHVVVDILANGMALSFAGILVKAEVDAAIHACVRYIIRYSSEIGIVAHDARS